eukprot:8617800-Pyramimonas_sp.AAC.1
MSLRPLVGGATFPHALPGSEMNLRGQLCISHGGAAVCGVTRINLRERGGLKSTAGDNTESPRGA